MCKCTCTLRSLTCTLNVHYENLQFDRVKGRVRDPYSNSVLLLTSSIYVPSFIILRQIGLELRWKQTDRQTDGHTRRSHKVFLWNINNKSETFQSMKKWVNPLPTFPCSMPACLPRSRNTQKLNSWKCDKWILIN